MSGQRHYIVAGGGLAGLSAAIELASSGRHAVALYERSQSLGGRAATHSRAGFAMNIGPHGFYRAGFMRAQFDFWGIAYSGNPPFGKGDACLISGGGRHRFPGNAAALMRCGAFSLSEKVRVGQRMAGIARAKGRPGESMQEWIHRQSASVTVRHFLAAMTRLSTYSTDAGTLDASAALRQLQIAAKASVLYIDGGWETVVNGLVSKAHSLGVTIHAGMGVAGVEPGTVRLQSGERVAADGVVLALPPRAVQGVTGCVLPVMIPARAACLDLGLRRLPERAVTFALGLEDPTYMSVHSQYARGLVPEGGALVQLAMYLGIGQSCSRERLEQHADLVLPGWRDEVAYARFLPDMTVVHAVPSVEHPRPDVNALAMPGVVVAGDWVGSQAMLADAAVASAVRAAQRLTQAVLGKAA